MDAVTAPPTQTAGDSLSQLGERIARGGVVVLSGAGLSTESGIPDYRGPTGSLRRNPPMTYQAFTGSALARRRYWARSYLGWRQIAAARPNAGHLAVARLQESGRLGAIITQNVDGLHQAAGARDVVELHGGLDLVVCLQCGMRESRAAMDDRLRAVNADFVAAVSAVNPDGDVELSDDRLAEFEPVDCRYCDSDLLKPDVVFFGENVPRPRVDACYYLVEAAATLLVLGSSLSVQSGLRFVRRAARLAIPVVIVNQGPTRGDEYAQLKVEAPLGVTLSAVAASV